MKTNTASSAKTATTATTKPVQAPKKQAAAKVIHHPRVKKLHPAEAAGVTVHQTVESGVAAVRDTLITVGTYGLKFVTGLVKGH